jgi:hypothetical protein
MENWLKIAALPGYYPAQATPVSSGHSGEQ